MSIVKNQTNISIAQVQQLIEELSFVKSTIICNNQVVIVDLGKCKGVRIRLKSSKIYINNTFSRNACRIWFYLSVLVLGIILPVILYFFLWYIPTQKYCNKIKFVLKENA
jgi:hypothetical protein